MLLEKFVANIEENIDSLVIKSQIAEVKPRRDEIRLGKVLPIGGKKGLGQVRDIIKK